MCSWQIHTPEHAAPHGAQRFYPDARQNQPDKLNICLFFLALPLPVHSWTSPKSCPSSLPLFFNGWCKSVKKGGPKLSYSEQPRFCPGGRENSLASFLASGSGWQPQPVAFASQTYMLPALGTARSLIPLPVIRCCWHVMLPKGWRREEQSKGR